MNTFEDTTVGLRDRLIQRESMSLPEPYYQDEAVTIYHADCRDILPHLPKVDLVLTDPPYGSGGRDGSVHLNDDSMFGNKMLNDSYIWFLQQVAKECFKKSRDDSHCYTFSDWRKWKDAQVAFETTGWELRSLIVWDKGNGMGEFWRSSYELILFLTKRKPRKLNRGDCYNVIKCPSVKGKLHPAEKPLDLLCHLIDASSIAGDLIFDPFAGSGTTLVAAKRLGRKAIGIEIEEKYCRIAVERLKQGQLI